MKLNCVNCKNRCITDDQYLTKPYKNMYGEETETTCLVVDTEIDETLPKPSCYEERGGIE